MGTLIIFGIFILTAFFGGFFVGYYKREGKKPEILPEIKEIIAAVVPAKEEKLSKAEQREIEKMNEFYN